MLIPSTTSRLGLLSESLGSLALVQRFDIASANHNSRKRRRKRASFRPLNFIKYFMSQGYGATPHSSISLGSKIMSMPGLYLDGPLCRQSNLCDCCTRFRYPSESLLFIPNPFHFSLMSTCPPTVQLI